MASRHDIIHIDFQASAGRANSAIKSIQAEADKAAAEVKRLRDTLKNLPEGTSAAEYKKLQDQLAAAEQRSKEWNKAVRDLTKGVTALDEAIKLFNKGQGSVEGMSVALAKTAKNAALFQQSRLETGSKDWKEMDALIHALDITVVKGTSDLDGLIATIKSGGSASKSVLEQAMRDLEALRNLEVSGSNEWKNFDAQLQTVISHVSELNKQELQGKASILNEKNLGQYDETKIRAAIDATKELMKTVPTASDEYKQYAQNIVNAEKHLEQYGLAAERTAAKEAAALEKQKQEEEKLLATMTNRLSSLNSLSADALAETKRYWEAQKKGATEGSDAFNKAATALKEIREQEKSRSFTKAEGVLGNMGNFGVSEIKSAIQEMERLRDSVSHGGEEWVKYNQYVEQGKTYLDNLAKTEAAQRIEKQMQNLTTISEKGLAEVKKYWETMVAGAERGSTELATYEANLKRVTEEEKARNIAAAQQKVSILSSGNLGNYSENEIRAAIAAGNQLIKTYETADPIAQQLGRDIVAAEEHLKQYGTEAARTAMKEKKALEEVEKKRRDTDNLMQQQLAKGTALSQQALKEQERYWQKMIDDPRSAAESLQQYQANLAQVKAIQEQMAAEAGQNALAFFRGDTKDASAAQIQENAKALKAYRDSLPRETEAQVINEINGYLQQAGVIAGEDATKMMSLADAEQLAATAGTNAFRGTTEQLTMAKKAIQDAMTTTEKGSAEYLELAEALRRVELELSRTGELSKEVQGVLAQPKGRSMDELADAIKRAEARLRELNDSSKEYKRLAEQIKNCKDELQRLEKQSRNSATAFEKAWSRLKTYVGVYVSAAVAMQKIISTFQKANELSDKMGEVGKTTGMTNEQLAHLQESLGRISTRQSMNELVSLSAAAGQLGLKAEQDVLAFTRAANKITVALPEMGREGVTELMKIAKATGTVEELQKQINHGLIEESNAVEAALTRVGSTIDALRANSASTAPRITDFVKRVGAVGAQSGMTIDQVAALGSTVDALGMRVEMSATALSRMIPAIKNNAFAISKAIEIAPEEITRMYEAGDAMQVIIKLLKAMGGKGEDEIEGMLNQSGFGDILKDLNQQGARAGMVFAGLAQNVGELERQLDIAHDAFEENIAIEQEYLRMNETSAGKLAQLGNTLTNFFVRASTSNFLGKVYDFLNWFFKNWIDNPRFQLFFNTLIGYLVVMKTNLAAIIAQGTVAGLKAIGTAFVQIGRSITNMVGGLKNVKTGLREVKETTMATNMANAWLALATAIWMAYNAIKAWYEEAHKVEKIASEAMSRVASETDTATRKVDKFFDSIGNARVAIEDTKKEVEEAKKAVDEAKKSLDGSRESVEKLEKAESDLKIAEEKSAKANDDHAASIRKLNQEYEPYLGYMLSEISTAQELANARDLINAKLRETILLKQKESAYGRIEEEYGGERDEKRQHLYSEIGDMVTDPTIAASIRKDINNAIKQNLNDYHTFEAKVENILSKYGIRVGEKSTLVESWDYSNIINAAQELRKQELKIEEARQVINEGFDADIKAARTGTKTSKGTQQELEEQFKAIDEGEKTGLKHLEELYKKADDTTRKERAAALLKQMDAYEELLSNSENYFDRTEKDEEESYKTLRENGDKRMKELREQREKLIEEAGDAYKSVNNPGDSYKPKNPWGDKPTAETPYEQWDADALVARRKSMNTFVRALSEGTDVQSVLKQDAALKNAIEKGMSSDMRTVIAWYNEERLKIQEELHDRNLTNTGAWLDPKKGRSKKPKQVMSEAAIAELERYYEWRKTVIDDARIKEGLSEEEYNRRMEALEQEHLQKRHDLRDSFTSEDKAFIQQFRQWWESVAELDEVEWSGIEAEWKVAWERDRKRNNYLAEKDLASMRAITVKHLKAIEDIINKERPYDGIIANLRKNLTELGILYADMNAENQKALEAGLDKPHDDAEYVEQTAKRMSFLLEQSESAYTLTVEELMKRLADKGMVAWADELKANPQMQESLLAHLRNTYEKVQEAIKREATLIKKEMDIWWSDIAPGADKSRKDTFESSLSQLGLLEDNVKRANQLIGAGAASERVADKLAIKQMQVRLAMQATYYAKMREIGEQKIRQLEEEIKLDKEANRLEDAKHKRLDVEHLRRSLNLAKTEEQKKIMEQQLAIAKQIEESQNRLYTSLREWADVLTSGLQGVLEAGTSGNAEYYNKRAVLEAEGSFQTKSKKTVSTTTKDGGSPTTKTTVSATTPLQDYYIIENAGTNDAKARKESLTELEYLEKQHEIELHNARMEAWKKLMDDLNQKMNEQITDWINASLQNASIDANTTALGLNTAAIASLTEEMLGKTTDGGSTPESPINPTEPTDWMLANEGVGEVDPAATAQAKIDADIAYTNTAIANASKRQKAGIESDNKIAGSAQSAFARMSQAANLYGAAYAAVTNDNLTWSQKFASVAIQAAGNTAITMLTTKMSETTASTVADTPAVLSKLWKQLGWGAIPVFAIFTGLLGGLMGLAASAITKGKSEIASATGTSNSVASGRLVTGMLTYAEGNVNEFTDPNSLQEGRTYNVDAADGKTYRAKYTGRNPKTHITNGPEFHLAGEKGREAIIDARTTRQIQMNDNGIWRAIQTLYNGGRLRRSSLRKGIPAFAEGNLDDFDASSEALGTSAGGMDIIAMQAALDRNSAIQEALLGRLAQPIKAVVSRYGKDGIVYGYDQGKKEAQRYGQSYIE